MSLRCLVVGYGSIGARHAAILETLGHKVSVVSRRGVSGDRPVFRTLAEALGCGSFDYVVIAVETGEHQTALAELAARGHSGIVLVEKPLFAAPALLPCHRFSRAAVGYNLRFHPAIEALRAVLGTQRAEAATLYVGQWLGDWRPGRQLATSYSASRAAGGGVLRDLSHELDLVTWLFGPWQRVAALGGRLSNVTVDADDAWSILLTSARCPIVSLQMNCLDRPARRDITVQTGGQTLVADLIANTLSRAGNDETFAAERDASYAAMHRSVIEGAREIASFEDGLATVELIASIEQAAREGRWIQRNLA